jgi:hypothetical protein
VKVPEASERSTTELPSDRLLLDPSACRIHRLPVIFP